MTDNVSLVIEMPKAVAGGAKRRPDPPDVVRRQPHETGASG